MQTIQTEKHYKELLEECVKNTNKTLLKWHAHNPNTFVSNDSVRGVLLHHLKNYLFSRDRHDKIDFKLFRRTLMVSLKEGYICNVFSYEEERWHSHYRDAYKIAAIILAASNLNYDSLLPSAADKQEHKSTPLPEERVITDVLDFGQIKSIQF